MLFRFFFKSFLRIFFVFLIVSMVVLIGVGFGMVIGYIKVILLNVLDIIIFLVDSQIIIVYDQSGNEIVWFYGNENRIRVLYSKILKNFINVFVVIEDERFWQYNGIDIKRIFGVIFKNIKIGFFLEGVSIIIQQFVRNKFLIFEKFFK